jgi:hypothetical protein
MTSRIDTAELQQAAEILKRLGGKTQLTQTDVQTATLTLAYVMGVAETMGHIAPGEFLKLVGRPPAGKPTGHPNVLLLGIAADLEGALGGTSPQGLAGRQKSWWDKLLDGVGGFINWLKSLF